MLHLYSWVGEEVDGCFTMCFKSIFNLGSFMFIIKADMDFRGPRNNSVKYTLCIKSHIFKLEGT